MKKSPFIKVNEHTIINLNSVSNVFFGDNKIVFNFAHPTEVINKTTQKNNFISNYFYMPITSKEDVNTIKAAIEELNFLHYENKYEYSSKFHWVNPKYIAFAKFEDIPGKNKKIIFNLNCSITKSIAGVDKVTNDFVYWIFDNMNITEFDKCVEHVQTKLMEVY
jgi:hypothetical protein